MQYFLQLIAIFPDRVSNRGHGNSHFMRDAHQGSTAAFGKRSFDAAIGDHILLLSNAFLQPHYRLHQAPQDSQRLGFLGGDGAVPGFFRLAEEGVGIAILAN